MDTDSQARYNAIFTINASILAVYLPLMLTLVLRRKLFISANVLLWS
jgi:hypothetical protein